MKSGSLLVFFTLFTLTVPAQGESIYRCDVYVKVELGPLANTNEMKSGVVILKDKATTTGEFLKIGKKFELELVDGTKTPTAHYKGMQILRLRLLDTGSSLTMLYPLDQKVMDGTSGSKEYYLSVRCSR